MQIKGIVFAGSATTEREATRDFFSRLFSQEPEPLADFPADVFDFPDGSAFGVVQVPEADMGTRTIGFLVDDLDSAAIEMKEMGLDVGDVGSNQLGRYLHFTAPDGRLYELVEKP